MLNFEDFLFVLRGRPNEERQAVIDFVYGIFDKEKKMFYLYLKNFNHQVKMTVTKKVIKYFF